MLIGVFETSPKLGIYTSIYTSMHCIGLSCMFKILYTSYRFRCTILYAYGGKGMWDGLTHDAPFRRIVEPLRGRDIAWPLNYALGRHGVCYRREIIMRKRAGHDQL
jgi:hypothetical protein